MDLKGFAIASCFLWSTAVCAGHPVVSVGGGFGFSPDVGQGQYFPIVNPVTDEFYFYSAGDKDENAGLFNAFIGYEWAMTPWWWGQLGINYSRFWTFNVHGSLVQGADLPSADVYPWGFEITSQQVLVDGKLLYRGWSDWHPYIIAGLGAAFNEATHFHVDIWPPFTTFSRVYLNHATTSFTYNVGLGIDINICPQWRIGISYRFTDLGNLSLGKAFIDTTAVPGTLSQSHLYVNELMADLTWVIL